MTEIVAILMVFGPIFYAVKRSYDLKDTRARRELGPGERSEEDTKLLDALRRDRKLLQERVENLESIVCDVDFELNQRIAKLAGDQERLSRVLPPAPATAKNATAPRPVDPAGQTASGRVAGDPSDGVSVANPPRRTAPDLAVGAIIGNRYRIDRELGRGGMGVVYLAHDEVLGESVALKMMGTGWARSRDEVVDRFRREASSARRINSPNVIRIHDLGEAQGLLYLSMEYFVGRTLAQVIQVRGTLSLNDCRDIIGQVCDGLAAAHAAGVVHRDLKPHNVLVGERNAVKIIDFGLAKTVFLDGLTATGLIMGTPEYMSPEQVRGAEVDGRSDLYSLGALTYHAVTGRPPFEGTSSIAVGFAHCTQEPRPPKELRPDVPDRLNEMILMALAKEPAKRPQSAADFRRGL